MKKIRMFLISSLMLAFLVACNGDEDGQVVEDNNESSEEVSSEEIKTEVSAETQVNSTKELSQLGKEVQAYLDANNEINYKKLSAVEFDRELFERDFNMSLDAINGTDMEKYFETQDRYYKKNRPSKKPQPHVWRTTTKVLEITNESLKVEYGVPFIEVLVDVREDHEYYDYDGNLTDKEFNKEYQAHVHLAKVDKNTYNEYGFLIEKVIPLED